MSTDQLYYPGQALKLGVDGMVPYAPPLSDECCAYTLCVTEVQAMCSMIDLLPTGPMWDSTKANVRQQIVDAGGMPLAGFDCTSMVAYAAYLGLVLKDIVDNTVGMSVRESQAHTATQVDDFLARLNWQDCYRTACRSSYMAKFSPYETDDGGCSIYCPSGQDLEPGTVTAFFGGNMLPNGNLTLSTPGQAGEGPGWQTDLDIISDPSAPAPEVAMQFCAEDDGQPIIFWEPINLVQGKQYRLHFWINLGANTTVQWNITNLTTLVVEPIGDVVSATGDMQRLDFYFTHTSDTGNYQVAMTATNPALDAEPSIVDNMALREVTAVPGGTPGWTMCYDDALKHAIIMSLTRAQRGFIRNLNGFNWVLAPLGAQLQPAPFPEIVQTYLDGECDCDVQNGDQCPPCFCGEVSFEIVSTGEYLPGAPTAESFCGGPAPEPVPAEQTYVDCNGATRQLYPGVIAAECIARSFMPNICPNIIYRA